jgi:glycosyltransferase involved in cell wall biosynthesis
MPPITALIHTTNDALRIGRCLETLYPCRNVVIIDHGSTDDTVAVAREYGAAILNVTDDQKIDRTNFLHRAAPGDWLLCLEPRESLTESLAASLYEFTVQAGAGSSAQACAVTIREETHQGWIDKEPQIRLVSPDWPLWDGRLPRSHSSGVPLEGALLRFCFP